MPDLILNEEELMLQTMVRDFADRELIPRAKEVDEKQEFSWENWRGMADLGLTGVGIETEYGGSGAAGYRKVAIVAEEVARGDAGASVSVLAHLSLGTNTIYRFGNEEQKKRFLPDIVKGKIRWCQGYSEPGAGSDLAGLQTKCEDKGDHWLINGQKVWTSYADEADWIFCLVRTDTSVKHEGISFIVFDMESEGVETRPIKLISGSSPFCETFFTDVKVPKEQMVGRYNGGWEIAKRLLQYERSNISAGGFGSARGATPLQDTVKQYVDLDENGKIEDAALRLKLAQTLMADKAFNLTVRRMAEQAKAGDEVGHTASIIKYAAAKLNQNKTELVVEAMGAQGLGWDGDAYSEKELAAPKAMLRAKANSIEGGTSEVNLNVVAKRVLGLKEHKG